MTEQEALLVLNAVHGLGAYRIRKLTRFFGNAVEVLKAREGGLAQSACISTSQIENILNFSKDKFLEDEYNLRQRKRVGLLTAVDADYPSSLKNFEDAPVVLYVKGKMDCLNQMSVGMVGSRAASYYGLKIAQTFAKSFVKAGLVVVSGLARGIDTSVHQGSLQARGLTIAVIGCGFNHMYPKENQALSDSIAQHGAVVSEFPMNTLPLKQNFPWRNRIISALSLATVVIEAGDKSGALITADFALAQNKDVFVVPANIDTPTAIGSNRLIQDGAKVALGPDDVLSQIKEGHISLKSSEATESELLLNDQQKQVYPHLTHQPLHVDDLVRLSGLSISEFMSIVLGLELKGIVRQLPGQFYVRNEHG